MGETVTNLKVKFGVDNSNLKSGFSDTEKALKKIDDMAGNSVRALTGLLSPLALIAGAGGGLAVLKDAIASVEGPGDRFEAAMGGAKEALFEVQRALGAMDFTNFFTNLTEGFQRGKQFTEALDALADRAAYNDYKIAELNRDSESLQEVVKNKTLELNVRTEAAKKVLDIEALIVKRKLELAQEEFNIAKAQWESRNKMEASEAVKLYEIIDNMAPELKERLQKAYSGAVQNQLGSVKKGIQSVLFGQYDPELVKEVPKETLESYGQFFQLLEKGERDVLLKLFNTFKEIDEKGYSAQKEYNAVVAQTTRLLAQEEKQLQKIKSAQEDINVTREPAPAKVGTGNLTMPSFGQLSFPDIVKPAKAASDSLKMVLTDINAVNQTIKEAIVNGLIGFGQWIGAFALGVAGIGDLVKILGNTFGDMLVQLGKIAITTGLGVLAIVTSLKTLNPYVAIGAGIALVALGTMVKGAVARIPDKAGSGSGSMSLREAGPGVYDTRTEESIKEHNTLHLKGKFLLEGKDLVCLIDQEYSRKKFST
jgi:hypothetical protein